ncbi:hypothetical protein [Persephonella sp.]
MKTKAIGYEPYLTVLSSWELFSNIILSPKSDVKEVLKNEIWDKYRGESTYYLDYVIDDAVDDKQDHLMEYIDIFSKSLDNLHKYIFDDSGKVKNSQAFKIVSSVVFRRMLFVYNIHKNFKVLRMNPENLSYDYLFDIPYYIDNLRETHIHGGLAYNLEDILEFMVKNFSVFRKNINLTANKEKEAIERLKLILVLHDLLLNKKNIDLRPVVSLLRKINEKIPLSIKNIYTKEFNLSVLIGTSIKNVNDPDVSVEKKLLSIMLILNLNQLVKRTVFDSLYTGLKYFSEEYVRKSPMKILTLKYSERKNRSNLFNVYKKFFSKDKKTKAYEIRIYFSEKNFVFWTELIKHLEDKTGKSFSLIVHFGRARTFAEFENIESLMRKIYTQSKRLAKFLSSKSHEYIKYMSAIDTASIEYWTPPWVFSALYRFWRKHAVFYIPSLNERKSPLKFTYHAGEDFLDLGTGLKNIYEAIKFLNLKSGDRIGHAVALGIDINSYSLKYRKIKLSPLSYFFHLLWLNYLCYEHKELFSYRFKILREIIRIVDKYQFLRDSLYREEMSKNSSIESDIHIYYVNLYEALQYDFVNLEDNSLYGRLWNLKLENDCPKNESYKDFPCRSILTIKSVFSNYRKVKKALKDRDIFLDPLLDENAELSFDEQIDLLKLIQDITLNLVIDRGIVIESCPTSNLKIRNFTDYKEHFIAKSDVLKLIADNQLKITINSDDPLVFDNNTLEEYLLVNESIPQELQEKVITKLIENSNKFGFR